MSNAGVAGIPPLRLGAYNVQILSHSGRLEHIVQEVIAFCRLCVATSPSVAPRLLLADIVYAYVTVYVSPVGVPKWDAADPHTHTVYVSPVGVPRWDAADPHIFTFYVSPVGVPDGMPLTHMPTQPSDEIECFLEKSRHLLNPVQVMGTIRQHNQASRHL